jgi:hypothetical protein
MQVDFKDVLAKLQAAPGPVTFTKLKKDLGVKKKGEQELRAALASEGIFAWAKPKDSYWHSDPAVWLSAEILSQCGRKALKKAEIKVKGRTGKDVSAAVAELVADKKLIKYPALAGAVPLWVAAAAPRAYWAYVEEFVAAKLKKAGIEEVSLEEKICQELLTLEPDKDVPVSVVNVRNRLAADKNLFDAAALKLREQRRIHLSLHDDPYSISAEDRESLIDGKDGRYYVAITRREQ